MTSPENPPSYDQKSEFLSRLNQVLTAPDGKVFAKDISKLMTAGPFANVIRSVTIQVVPADKNLQAFTITIDRSNPTDPLHLRMPEFSSETKGDETLPEKNGLFNIAFKKLLSEYPNATLRATECSLFSRE